MQRCKSSDDVTCTLPPALNNHTAAMSTLHSLTEGVKPECSDSKQGVHTDDTRKRLEQRYERNRPNPISEGSVRISNSSTFHTPYAAERKLAWPSKNPETKTFNGLCNALLFHILTLPLLCKVHRACISQFSKNTIFCMVAVCLLFNTFTCSSIIFHQKPNRHVTVFDLSQRLLWMYCFGQPEEFWSARLSTIASVSKLLRSLSQTNLLIQRPTKQKILTKSSRQSGWF